ncbi:peptidoglycan-binding protein [Mycolicibacterium peregrinum]|uniref:peptidoglycan-binding protein n=1 Tax=Mycolicibacterium peregrinum TaxID=43304 RepID=UPI003AAD9579
MGFRTAYGNTYSENGWRMCDRDECDDGAVPGTSLRLPIRRGIANLILKGWVAYYHREIESLSNSRGFTDEGSWTPTNDVATSNHLSGTAVDLNWSDHAFRVSYSGFTQAEIDRVRTGLRLFEGTIWWGQDWTSPKDPMHFQLNYREGDARNAAFATKLQNGYLNIWKDYTGGPITNPAPVQDIYAERGDTGDRVLALQQFLNANFPSYSQLDEDGDFGPATERVIKTFQLRVGVLADGIVGPQTLGELVDHGFKPDTKEAVVAATDRQLLEQISADVKEIRAQLSPEGHPSWPTNGPEGQRMSVRDSIAAWGKKNAEAS